jgi:hypothetical protein
MKLDKLTAHIKSIIMEGLTQPQEQVQPVVKKRRAPSVKRASTKAQKEVSRGFPLPLYLICPVTKKTNKYTSLQYIRKLISKHGTIEDVKKNYVSAEGRKLQNNNQS